MKLNVPKIKSYKALALLDAFIATLIMIILYFTLPAILNYPKNSIDNNFQIEVVGIKYTQQFIILSAIIVALVYIGFRFVYSRINFNSNSSKTTLLKIREKCFNYPYLMILLLSFVPAIICGILLIVFKTDFELLLKLCIVILSFGTVYSIMSYMIGKNFFESKLIESFAIVGNKKGGIRLEIFKKLLIEIVPLFLYSFILLLLISTTIMTTEKGDLLYNIYRNELVKEFDSSKVYTLSEVQQKLNTLSLNSERDHYVILSAEDGSVYYSPETINDFFIKYALTYYDEMNGHIFEYYGQNSQAAVIKVHTDQGDYFAGIRFFVFANGVITPFIIVTAILIIFNLIFVVYIGKGLSNDIKNVNDGMDNISNSENIVFEKNLPITSNDEMADLILAFNKIQDITRNYVNQIHDNQNMLMERERLASLGQLIGGIAHNLKTPIMSISGAAEGLTDLVKEYEASVGDPEVTVQDHHDIAKDMKDWIEKIRSYTEYMSDIITAVKGQAVTMSEEQAVSFTLDELVKRVNILMRHELKNALVELNVSMQANEQTILKGNINSLVQVINNMISNAIQAYDGKPDNKIDLILKKEDNNIVISVKDYGCGLPDEVQKKLFKEMITTKGKNGTGLGLFMSYSTIRAHFNGNMTFETEQGKGTTFNIILPL